MEKLIQALEEKQLKAAQCASALSPCITHFPEHSPERQEILLEYTRWSTRIDMLREFIQTLKATIPPHEGYVLLFPDKIGTHHFNPFFGTICLPGMPCICPLEQFFHFASLEAAQEAVKRRYPEAEVWKGSWKMVSNPVTLNPTYWNVTVSPL